MSRARARGGNGGRRGRRRGSVLPLVACSMVGLCGFVALAVDVGMIVTARTEAQNAADAAALSGARALDGRTGWDTTVAEAAARGAVGVNTVLGTSVDLNDVTIEHGSYGYNYNTEVFSPHIPPAPGENFTLTRVSVEHHAPTAFANVVGISGFDVRATATATHRPRDIAMVLDFSGSMNNESDLWNNESYLGSANNTPNNRDEIVPEFGAYSATSTAALRYTGSDDRIGKCNITQAALGVPALVNDFYQHDAGVAPSHAFSAKPDTYAESPGGDDYLRAGNSSGGAYVKTFYEMNGNKTTRNAAFEETDPGSIGGYDYYTYAQPGRPRYPFKGYTEGPKYWGKTFFLWPPNPKSDWRKLYFRKTGGSYPNFGGAMDSNQSLWDSSGNWRSPGSYYVINYKAILAWIKSAPNPFPSQLRSGRVLYYDAIPDDVPSAAYNHSRSNSLITDPNQRFWKEYIDFALGVWRDPQGTIRAPGSQSCSYGPDFTWGTIRISAKPSTLYMDYRDNPERPRHRFWFGPMTMIQYLLDTGMMPGTGHDISMYPAKLGIATALEDIKNNHPNDLVALIPFNRPQYGNEPEEVGAFSQALFDLGRDYAGMIDALWFPRGSSSGADVRPWSTADSFTPRAKADFIANTCTQHGFMLAYNQLSSSPSLRSVGGGGFGRRGAQRLVILETDGMANVNTRPSQSFWNGGTARSYYRIRPGDSITATSYSESDLLSVVRRICALETDGSTGPGYSSARKQVYVHTIAFGSIFEPDASGSDRSNAISLLQKISQIGGTTFPSSSSDGANGYKWCIGNMTERKDKLREAISRAADDGVSVILID